MFRLRSNCRTIEVLPSDEVDVIAVTGSTEVGKYFLKYSGESNMKQVWLECGGKSPNIVLGDAPNLDVAAQRTAFGIWFNQGEVCTAGSRLIVEDSIKDKFLEKVMAIGQKMQPGDTLEHGFGERRGN